MNFKKKDILIIFLILFLFYLINQKNEKMSDTKTLEESTREYTNKVMENIRSIKNVTNQLTSKDKTIKVKNLTLDGPFNILPKGTIVAWFNENPPKDWFKCDGTNGTPDLRGKFIYGYKHGSTIGRKGGEESHKLTSNEIPSHKHSISISGHGSHSHYITSSNFVGKKNLTGVSGSSATRCKGSCKNKSGIDSSNASTVNINGSSTTSAGGHAHSISPNTIGRNEYHNNMPPYHTLNWIMKA